MVVIGRAVIGPVPTARTPLRLIRYTERKRTKREESIMPTCMAGLVWGGRNAVHSIYILIFTPSIVALLHGLVSCN